MTGTNVDLRGDPRRLRNERRVRRTFLSAAIVSIAISVGIVMSLFGGAIDFLTEIDLGQLWANGWFPRRGRFDLRTVFVHTLLIAALALLVAAPLGLGVAVYLSEYAANNTRRILKPLLEILAGIPSVVIGFFALTFITPEFLAALWSSTEVFNLAAAGIGVGILIIPLVASISEDALSAVPDALREASYGLGAKKWHTTARVVLPSAVSGVAAAMILAVSRAIGETMVVAIAAGAAGGSLLTLNIAEGGQTMTGAMASLAIGSDQVAGNNAAFKSLFFLGLLLFGITLLLNTLSERIVNKYRQRY